MNHLFNIKHLSLGLLTVLLYACAANEEILDTRLEKDSVQQAETKGNAADAQYYYWHNGSKVSLSLTNEKTYLIFNAKDERELLGKTAKIYARGSISDNYKWAVIPEGESQNLAIDIIYRGPSFRLDSGLDVVLSHLAYVKLQKESDVNFLRENVERLGLQIVDNNEYMPLWYTVDCSLSSVGNALEIANILYESGAFSAVQPDLMTESIEFSIPNDPYFSYQWNLNNTGQYGDSYSGIDIRYTRSNDMSLGSSNTIVAVIDQGVELNHPDMNMSSLSYDTINSSSPSIVRGNHGTACAGIISALVHNGLGVAGIAPYCPIMSISHTLAYSTNLAQQLANGFGYARTHGAAVISNSWGGLAQSQILEDAINNALTMGRNGKGCVVVFAAGNSNVGNVAYPANAIDDIIVVGAMSPDGLRKSTTTIDGETWWGSNYGAELDIVAPGVKIPTTDRTGSYGYNTSGDYYLEFNGTSSACPHVAAVAALVLSEKPSLTQQQVASAILTSTTKLSNYSFSTNKTYGTWNQEVGYGLLNAKAAIQTAVGNVTVNYSNETVTGEWVSLIGSNIYVSDVTVQSGAKLSLAGSTQCTITQPLVVESGASFVMQN